MVFHGSHHRFRQPLAPNVILLRLKIPRGKRARCLILYEDGGIKTTPMYLYAATPHYLYYQGEVEVSRPGECRYFFRCQLEEGEPFYIFDGVNGPGRPFLYRWDPAKVYEVPPWVYDAVSYQIFPDRFYNGDPRNDPPGTEPWGGIPTRDNFFGGDLDGIWQKIPYLQFLGINTIWLNPIFASPSNHRYNTSDYLKIDPALGDEKSLHRLVEGLHAANMRLILDGVFNHTGTEFFAFKDVLVKGAASSYKDWYYFEGFPVQMEPRPNYLCWWNIPSLPKLKVENPEVREYLLGVGTYWLREAGIDGWRLDVPNEVEPSFWREFRRQVKETKADAYIVGEIWRDARFWLLGGYFDGVMNYLFRDLVLDFFAHRRFSISTLDFLLGLIRLRYPEAANFALLNLLGSHDTARVITAFQQGLTERMGHTVTYEEAVRRLRPALILQFTYPGIPLIYYGDEVGLTGGPDPDCRQTMPWEPQRWDQELLRLYRRLIKLRRSLPPLKGGFFQPLFTDDGTDVYAFARRLKNDKVVVVINASDFPQSVSLRAEELGLQEDEVWADALNGRYFTVVSGQMLLPLEANWGAVLYRYKRNFVLSPWPGTSCRPPAE
ncbi:MAG: glycoside hydrolase family 13 protein [Moorella sp. (in: firmicutes)]